MKIVNNYLLFGGPDQQISNTGFGISNGFSSALTAGGIQQQTAINFSFGNSIPLKNRVRPINDGLKNRQFSLLALYIQGQCPCGYRSVFMLA
jgi:hypothetical protein